MSWPRRIAETIARHGAVVRIAVIRVEGSSPRETGAAMLVSASATEDTVGGGALENEAIAHARMMIAGTDGGAAATEPAEKAWHRECRDFALGPSLGQCCGGAVRMLFERFTAREAPMLADLGCQGEAAATMLLRPLASGTAPHLASPEHLDERWPSGVSRAMRAVATRERAAGAMLIPGRRNEADWFLEPLAAPALPLVIYGAGHVGRALVRAVEVLPFRIAWVDGRPGAFPDAVAPDITLRSQIADPGPLQKTLPGRAIHIVMTHSHPLDLAICHAVLAEDDFRFLGLIGSATKRARFLKRLREAGLPEAQLARLVCPIGLPDIRGKHPAVIAASVAAQLLQIASGVAPL
jgi:xanthine dehydrogenase accessory factor